MKKRQYFVTRHHILLTIAKFKHKFNLLLGCHISVTNFIFGGFTG